MGIRFSAHSTSRFDRCRSNMVAVSSSSASEVESTFIWLLPLAVVAAFSCARCATSLRIWRVCRDANDSAANAPLLSKLRATKQRLRQEQQQTGRTRRWHATHLQPVGAENWCCRPSVSIDSTNHCCQQVSNSSSVLRLRQKRVDMIDYSTNGRNVGGVERARGTPLCNEKHQIHQIAQRIGRRAIAILLFAVINGLETTGENEQTKASHKSYSGTLH